MAGCGRLLHLPARAHRALDRQCHAAAGGVCAVRDARQARRLPAALGGNDQVRACFDSPLPVVTEA